tara:strand:- start:4148 stop:5167 length:1020 start_codon:yes stop_codon:yes gene_type:complete
MNSNNGASYIFNTSSWSAVKISVKFYRALTIKSKVQKYVLIIFLFLIGKFYRKICKSKNEIQQYLNTISKVNIDFNIDKESSVLVSPTRDKIIVNHHNRYFHKIAFGESFKKVKNETYIYSLLKNLKSFNVSNFYDLKIEDKSNYCSFKLQNPITVVVSKNEFKLTTILAEFFNKSGHNKTINFNDYIKELLENYKKLTTKKNNSIESYFGNKNLNSQVPLGLVHRDFKPWNTLSQEKLLIFDFEEAVFDGIPMEDLLNFYIDPIIRYLPVIEVYSFMFSKEQTSKYQNYLTNINCALDYELLIFSYLIERVFFWSKENDLDTALAYEQLLNLSITNKK